MRIRDPLVLRVVGKSILQTSLAVILFLEFFVLHMIILAGLLRTLIRIIDIEYQWKNFCQAILMKEWRKHCYILNERVGKFPLPFAVIQFVIISLILFFISFLCSELLFEIEDRSQMFLNWWRQPVHCSLSLRHTKQGA